MALARPRQYAPSWASRKQVASCVWAARILGPFRHITRMEQAVRSPRIEFRISRPGSKGPLWPIPQDCRVPARPRAAATVPRGTEFLDAETGGQLEK